MIIEYLFDLMKRNSYKKLWLIILFAFITVCSPKSRYRVLTVFFDGVPDPDIAKMVKSDSSKADTTRALKGLQKVQPKQPEYYFHPPYKEKSCDACHDTRGSSRLLHPQPQLCYECHDDLTEKYTVLHGPVASGYCTACHNPHMAKREKLLKRNKEQLCIFCHDSEQVFKNEAHEDVEKTECMDCHNPHGGDDQYIFNSD